MTVLGTPLSDGAKRVLLLGSGELGKEVVIELQRYGVETIAVDRYADAPAMQVAHRSHVIDMLDGAEIRRVIELERPDLIVPEIEAIHTPTLQALEREGFTVIPTARAAWLTMDREGIRSLAGEELGLPTSSYRFAGTYEEYRAAVSEIGMPCVVKPVMSSSGKGQSTIKNEGDIQKAWDYSQLGGRASSGFASTARTTIERPATERSSERAVTQGHGELSERRAGGGEADHGRAKDGSKRPSSRIIIEGFVDFDYEITLLTLRHKDGISFCAPVGHLQKDGDYRESWQPQPMSELARQRAEAIAAKVVDALCGEHGRGMFGVEFFIRGDEAIFSELSPRPHDTGLVTLISQDLSQFSLHARAILGLPIPNIRSRGAAASCAVLFEGDRKAPRYDGVADALAEADTQLRLFGKPEIIGKRRMAVTLALGEDIDAARDKARRAAAKLKLVD